MWAFVCRDDKSLIRRNKEKNSGNIQYSMFHKRISHGVGRSRGVAGVTRARAGVAPVSEMLKQPVLRGN